jgi:hypothetical protein
MTSRITFYPNTSDTVTSTPSYVNLTCTASTRAAKTHPRISSVTPFSNADMRISSTSSDAKSKIKKTRKKKANTSLPLLPPNTTKTFSPPQPWSPANLFSHSPSSERCRRRRTSLLPRPRLSLDSSRCCRSVPSDWLWAVT